MSEFTANQKNRVKSLEILFDGILTGKNLGILVRENKKIIDSSISSDVVLVVDQLVQRNIPMVQLKKGINKLLNLLHKTLSNHPYHPPLQDSYLGCLIENNKVLDEKLQQIRPLIREINKTPDSKELLKKVYNRLKELKEYKKYYLIKENVLFPVIEKYFPKYKCLQVMWSFHDDILRNLKAAIQQFEGESNFNLKLFNRQVGDLFFNIYAIKFREERILYPMVQDIIPGKVLNSLFADSLEIGFPFHTPEEISETIQNDITHSTEVNLETGWLTVEQIKLLFNHLPVDITFVDEFNKVSYFSSPKKRIFPRTKAVLGRDVHNCHPPESVHVVEQIVEAFRNGKKDVASFWINMNEEQLLIQYFAIRDGSGRYKGVVEVSQEISDIQSLKGEKKLLDWEN